MLIRMKPSANFETTEAITMWNRNKTGKWLHQKSGPEKEKIMFDARRKVDDAKERLKKKKEHLKERESFWKRSMK